MSCRTLRLLKLFQKKLNTRVSGKVRIVLRACFFLFVHLLGALFHFHVIIYFDTLPI